MQRGVLNDWIISIHLIHINNASISHLPSCIIRRWAHAWSVVSCLSLHKNTTSSSMWTHFPMQPCLQFYAMLITHANKNSTNNHTGATCSPCGCGIAFINKLLLFFVISFVYYYSARDALLCQPVPSSVTSEMALFYGVSEWNAVPFLLKG